MTKIYRMVSQSSWALGLLSILAAVIDRLFLARRLRFEPRTFLILAITFFLCALATRAMERT
jgi:hypothetical protein